MMSEETDIRTSASSCGMMNADRAHPAKLALSGLATEHPVHENWLDRDKFNHMARVAAMLAKSQLVPQNYQGRPEDCMIAFDMASRIGVSPLMVMQNLYVVKGKPSWSGQACMAIIKASARFRDVKHVYFGEIGTDSRGCFISAVRAADSETVEGVHVTVGMAKAEGWTSNLKWRNMPELMLAYRASAFFARVYCPDLLMGCQTVEEIEDVSADGDLHVNRQADGARELTAALDSVLSGNGGEAAK